MANEFFKGSTFVRMVMAKAIAHGEDVASAELAGSRWGEGSQPARLLKAAVAAGGTDNWGSEAVGEYASAAAEFIGLVRQQSIIGSLAGLRRVPLHMPTLGVSSGATGAWVKEGRPMPLSAMTFTRETLTSLKVAAMAVVTEEMLQSADPMAEQVIRDDLVRAVVEASDTAFINPANAGVADQTPASITNGVTAIAGTANFKSDLERLVAEFTGDLTNAYLIGKPELFIQISGADYPNIGARGGEIAGIPAIASRHVPDDGASAYQLALVDPTGIAYGSDEASAELKASRHGTIQMDSAPTNDSVTPTATNQVGMWQSNCVAIAAMMRENWKMVRPGSVALLNGITPATAP